MCEREKPDKTAVKESLETIYSLPVQPCGVTTEERDPAAAERRLTRRYGVLLCWQAPVRQDPLGSICQEPGKEDLIQEYFRHGLLKQRTFDLPLLNLAQSPPKGNRAPTARSVYFLLSWKAKVLLLLKGVTSIHQRKKWPIKAVKLVLFPLHKSTSLLYIKRWG